MNILYYSVHHVLEDDEVRLLQGLGHTVFCLGINSPHGVGQSFRPAIAFTVAEIALYDAYEAAGGQYRGHPAYDKRLPAGFAARFSMCIVMHDIGFISENRTELLDTPVVLRTIGQDTGANDGLVTALRHGGLYVVHYSPVEGLFQPALIHDAVIRFHKKPVPFHKKPVPASEWQGDLAQILTFANTYRQRYPEDASDYRQIVEGLPAVLGGVGNEDFTQAVGMISPERQAELYRQCRVYLYGSGLEIPYTLNFIEAWMAGIAVVVHAPPARVGPYFEIGRLIDHGRTGFVCGDVASARACVRTLLDDRALASRIGAAGRDAAIALFGIDTIAQQWALF